MSASDRRGSANEDQAYRALLLFDMGLYDATYDGGSNLGWESSNETRIQVHSYGRNETVLICKFIIDLGTSESGLVLVTICEPLSLILNSG